MSNNLQSDAGNPAIPLLPPATGSAFLPWNHPLRLEAEELVQRYHDYAQTHLPSANKRELAEMIVAFVQGHLPPNAPGEPRRKENHE